MSAKKPYDFLPSRSNSVIAWKKEGKKVFGIVSRTVPEELIYAAGIFPLHLLGSPETIKEAADCFDRWTCHWAQSVLDLGLAGEYEVLDGMVVPQMCDALIGLAGALESFIEMPFFYWLPHPHSAKGEGALEFFIEELERLKSSLEDFSGTEITTESLRRAIKLYNRNRSLLKEVYDLRGSSEGALISGVEATEMVLSSLLMPKEKSNRVMAQRIREAKGRNAPLRIKGPRLLISGCVLHDLKLFELIESYGAMVVADDLDTGSRYFWDPVDISPEPLEAIAKHRLLSNIPDAAFAAERATEERLDYIISLVRRYRVNGVIFALQAWCDVHEFDRLFLTEQLQQAGIPVLTIKVGGSSVDAQIKTMVEAFLETIRGGR